MKSIWYVQRPVDYFIYIIIINLEFYAEERNLLSDDCKVSGLIQIESTQWLTTWRRGEKRDSK